MTAENTPSTKTNFLGRPRSLVPEPIGVVKLMTDIKKYSSVAKVNQK